MIHINYNIIFKIYKRSQKITLITDVRRVVRFSICVFKFSYLFHCNKLLCTQKKLHKKPHGKYTKKLSDESTKITKTELFVFWRRTPTVFLYGRGNNRRVAVKGPFHRICTCSVDVCERMCRLPCVGDYNNNNANNTNTNYAHRRFSRRPWETEPVARPFPFLLF